jgi:Family of unknown function (DUF6184)
MRYRFPPAPLAALPLLFALAVAGCGGVTNPQIVARDQATTASCDWYQSCSQIGPGLTYETRQSCETQVRAKWDQAWPPASCDSKINQSQLSICLDAIHATQCGNALDILSTLGVKCAEASICSGP